MNNKPSYAYHVNGSSVHSSPSVSPDTEPVAELPNQPLPQIFEHPEERTPTPFPSPQSPQQPIDQPLPDLMSILSTSPGRQPNPNPQHSILIPATPTRQPLHPSLNPQPSNSGSSSSDIPPNPLTPVVTIISNPFATMSGSSSTASFHAFDYLIRRLREDRRINEESRSRSIATGLYEIANMILPQLPEYEDTVYDDLGQEEENQRRRRRETRRFIMGWCIVTGLIGTAVLGQQLGTALYFWNIKPR